MSTGRRVAVIGAGPNGLVCAAYLAAGGMDVTVMDGRDRAGGGVATSELTSAGFLHDECAGFFPLTAASPAFRDLPLGPLAVDWVTPPVVMAHPFEDGSAIALHRDVAATAASLDAAAPGTGAAWRSVIDPLVRHGEVAVETGLSRLPPVMPALRLAARLRTEVPDLLRRVAGSSSSFGRDVFGDEAATAWFAGSAAHSDLSPGAATGGGFSLALKLLGHLVGWPFPRGGAGKLADALAARVERLGGSIRCGAPVDRILVRRGRAEGVRLDSGEEVGADAVVATVSAGVLGRMLPDDALPDRLTRRLRRWRYGVGTFKLDLELGDPAPWASEECREAAVVHVAGTLDELFRAAFEAGQGKVPETPPMVVGQHSVHDATRAPEGGHTLYAYAHVPQRPDTPDDEIADRLEERIERFAPGFRKLVRARSLRSPAELERHNPSLVGGDLAGGSMEIDQQAIFRPAPEMARCRTPLRGLYVGGASVHPGPGVHGVPGAGAAEALLADRSALRFWR